MLSNIMLWASFAYFCMFHNLTSSSCVYFCHVSKHSCLAMLCKGWNSLQSWQVCFIEISNFGFAVQVLHVICLSCPFHLQHICGLQISTSSQESLHSFYCKHMQILCRCKLSDILCKFLCFSSFSEHVQFWSFSKVPFRVCHQLHLI